MRTEQRRHRRRECKGTAEIYLNPNASPNGARILDLSAEGCLVQLYAPMIIATDIQIEIAFEVNQIHFRVRAQIKTVRPNGLLGCHFYALHDRIRPHLIDLIDELLPWRTCS